MLEFKVYPEDYGWEDIHIAINEDKYDFCISYVGDTFFKLVSAAACLMEFPPYENYSEFIERKDVEIAGGMYDMAYKAELTWDMESDGLIRWTLEKPCTLDEDFMLRISLVVINFDEGEEEEVHNYEVNFREFCYALTKAFTEILKSTGICGYYDALLMSNMGDAIDLREFIYVKAFALHRLAEFVTEHVTDAQGLDRAHTNFAKEIELVLQDM